MDKQKSLEVAKAAASGAAKGGAVGAVASLATGAAIIVTAPAWLPFVGGAAAVSMATVGAWAAGGAAVGALGHGACKAKKLSDQQKQFDAHFPQES
jgi:hypothetical protein